MPEVASNTAILEEFEVGGMTCASCAARIERTLAGHEGVESAAVNYASHRATITYDPALVGSPELIEVVTGLGYLVVDDAAPPESEARAILPRLVAAIVLTVPVVAISMIPAFGFAGWPWVALVLSTPVVFWSGWSFHVTAIRNLRHHAVAMDTLISLGTLAAYFWSLVALVFLGADSHGGNMSLGAMFSDHGSTYVYFETSALIISLVLSELISSEAIFAIVVNEFVNLKSSITKRPSLNKSNSG